MEGREDIFEDYEGPDNPNYEGKPQRTIEELMAASFWTDEELQRLIDTLTVAAAALEPLGPHFALAREEVVRRLESAKQVFRVRNT